MRFQAVMTNNSIEWLSEKFVLMGQRLPKIIAIGDSNNDKPMLLASAVACVIPHLNGSCLALPSIHLLFLPMSRHLLVGRMLQKKH